MTVLTEVRHFNRSFCVKKSPHGVGGHSASVSTGSRRNWLHIHPNNLFPLSAG